MAACLIALASGWPTPPMTYDISPCLCAAGTWPTGAPIAFIAKVRPDTVTAVAMMDLLDAMAFLLHVWLIECSRARQYGSRPRDDRRHRVFLRRCAISAPPTGVARFSEIRPARGSNRRCPESAARTFRLFDTLRGDFPPRVFV